MASVADPGGAFQGGHRVAATVPGPVVVIVARLDRGVRYFLACRDEHEPTRLTESCDVLGVSVIAREMLTDEALLLVELVAGRWFDPHDLAAAVPAIHGCSRAARRRGDA